MLTANSVQSQVLDLSLILLKYEIWKRMQCENNRQIIIIIMLNRRQHPSHVWMAVTMRANTMIYMFMIQRLSNKIIIIIKWCLYKRKWQWAQMFTMHTWMAPHRNSERLLENYCVNVFFVRCILRKLYWIEHRTMSELSFWRHMKYIKLQIEYIGLI